MADPYGYDELPYPSAPYPYTHPDHLATLATLFGLEIAAVEDSRVLEVGCADGANLIPMAVTLPRGRFVGVDLSLRQVAAGRRLMDRLKLTNVELLHGDLRKFTADEPFDWIIAHGFYSWTPRETRSRLFDICHRHLARRGVALVSYNVLPGWQPRLALRQWLLQVIDQEPQTTERLRLARRNLRHLSKVLGQASGDRQLQQIRSEIERMEQWSDAYLRHDLLEDFNEPVSFADFVAHAREHGLRFFAEADLATMVGKGLPADVAHRLPQLAGTQLLREQVIDILTNRTFRQSLLCHQERCPRDHIGPDAVRSLYAVSTLKQVSDGNATNSGPSTFAGRSGFRILVEDPVCCEALRGLERRWPAGEFVTASVRSARDRLRDSGRPVREDEFASAIDALAAILLAGFADRCVELHVTSRPFETEPNERPEASRLARVQAEYQGWVSSLRHDLVHLSDKQRLLVRHLDGTCCRADLAERLAGSPQFAELEPVDEVIDSSWIETQLGWLARRGILCPAR
ncbi:MAG: class I SAM-dependent methyltransferase [Pirellulaceae bacterium]|nr:class I SAM-dependent methyltransferase [Pirellulaceae bacterium]